MIEVQSGDVSAMRDATVADLVDDLNKKQAQTPLSLMAAGGFALAGLAVMLLSNSGQQPIVVVTGVIIFLATLPAWAVGEWFDSYKRTSVLFYNLDAAAEAAYRRMTEGFDALAGCIGRWHIESGGAVQDLTTWKRNAGASHLITRKTACLDHGLPKVVRSNVTPPTICLGGRTFYFMPEIMIVKHGNRFGAVGYDDLHIKFQLSNFIEDGTPPADAQVVSYTWKHPNKSGGPDRRFRDNRQLPVCLYEVMHLSSASGANELMEFSRTGRVQPFSMALQDLLRKQAPKGAGAIALLGNSATPERSGTTVIDPSDDRSLNWKICAGAALWIAASALVVVAYFTHGGLNISTETYGQKANTSAASASDLIRISPPRGGILVQTPSDTSVKPVAPNLPTVTVKIAANIRSGPSVSAAIIRVANSGEKFSVFGRANGWVQIGTDKPDGWIAASLVTE